MKLFFGIVAITLSSMMVAQTGDSLTKKECKNKKECSKDKKACCSKDKKECSKTKKSCSSSEKKAA